MQTERRISNWVRWGAEDELGTLHLVDPQTIVEAAQLVKTGKTYRLAIPIDSKTSSPLRDGAIHVAAIRRDPTPSGRVVAVDIIAMDTHNFTHMDSLAHVSYGGFLFNGVSIETINNKGATRLSIENVKSIIGRSVLADVARARGVESLEAGYAIGPEDLDLALTQVGIKPKRGDILLVRTGWITRYLKDPTVAHQGWPGLGEASVEWLYDNEICAVGADNVAVEVKPFEDAQRSFIVHEKFIRDIGGYLIEFLDLEGLSADGVFEGFFVMTPLRIVGGLGSPVTPLVII